MVRSLIGPPLFLAFGARDSTRRVCVNDAKATDRILLLSPPVSFVAQSGCWCPPDPVDGSSLMRELVSQFSDTHVIIRLVFLFHVFVPFPFHHIIYLSGRYPPPRRVMMINRAPEIGGEGRFGAQRPIKGIAAVGFLCAIAI